MYTDVACILSSSVTLLHEVIPFSLRHVPIVISACCLQTQPRRHVTSLDAVTCSVRTWASTANQTRMEETGNSVMDAPGGMNASGPVSRAWLPPSPKITIMLSLEHRGPTTGKVEYNRIMCPQLFDMFYVCIWHVSAHGIDIHTQSHTNVFVKEFDWCLGVRPWAQNIEYDKSI